MALREDGSKIRTFSGRLAGQQCLNLEPLDSGNCPLTRKCTVMSCDNPDESDLLTSTKAATVSGSHDQVAKEKKAFCWAYRERRCKEGKDRHKYSQGDGANSL